MVRAGGLLLVIAAVGCREPTPSAPPVIRAAIVSDAGLAKAPEVPTPIPLEAEISNQMAVASAKALKWDEALAAADNTIAGAPKWSEAFYVRAGIHAALAGGSSLEGTTWRGFAWDERSELHFLASGRFTFRQFGSQGPTDGTGTWVLKGTQLALREDDGDPQWNYRYTGAIDGGVISGEVSTLGGGSSYFRMSGPQLRAPEEASGHLIAAASDLQTYLMLLPSASDRDAVIRTIAQLRLEANAQDHPRSVSAVDAGRPLTSTAPQSAGGPESPVQQGMGTLSVTSSPSQARATLDGVAIGYTNLRTEVGPGRHTLQLELKGYQPVNRSVLVRPGQTTTDETAFVALPP